MKLKARNVKGEHSPTTKGGRVMKQQKLNFFNQAKKRAAAAADPETQTNNNKKQKITDDEENNNEKKESKTRNNSRPSRSCNKENFEVETEKKRLDIIETKEDQQNGRKKDKTNLKPNNKKEKTVESMKEVKNSDHTEKRGISELSDRKKKGKEETEAKSKTKSEAEKALEKKDNEEEEEADENLDDREEKTFSNSMKDAVKTECKICGQPVALTSMRGHTKSSHKMSIGDYKEKHGNHRTQIIEHVYHKCGLCSEAILLDSDDIAFHLRKAHDITHKDYNSRFMTLKKDDKTVVKKPKAKMWLKPKRVEEQVKEIQKKACEAEVEEGSVIEVAKEGERKDWDEEGDSSSGPSGKTLSPEERERNLQDLFRHQRNFLKRVLADTDDEEEEKKEEEQEEQEEQSALP